MSGKLLLLLITLACLTQPSYGQFQPSHAWSISDINDVDGWYVRMDEPAFDSQGRLFASGLFKGELDLDGDGLTDLEPNDEDQFHRFIAIFSKGGKLEEAHRLWGDSDNEILQSGRLISLDSEDNIYLVGSSKGDLDVNLDNQIDITLPDTTTQFIAKYSQAFELQWVVAKEGTLLSRIRLLHSPQQNGFHLVGATIDPCTATENPQYCVSSRYERMAIRRYNNDGALLWSYANSDLVENPIGALKLDDAAITSNGDIYI